MPKCGLKIIVGLYHTTSHSCDHYDRKTQGIGVTGHQQTPDNECIFHITYPLANSSYLFSLASRPLVLALLPLLNPNNFAGQTFTHDVSGLCTVFRSRLGKLRIDAGDLSRHGKVVFHTIGMPSKIRFSIQFACHDVV